MDDAVLRAMLKWPDVPSVYGWLSLDRRGRWRIRTRAGTGAGTPAPQFEPIGNPALKAFIARNYLADERGCWFFQNGPQRVFVALAYTPMVYRLEGDVFFDHCGRAAGAFAAAWLDEEGSLILQAANGIGVLDDRDLAIFADQLAQGVFRPGDTHLPVGRVTSGKLQTRFGFVREPRA